MVIAPEPVFTYKLLAVVDGSVTAPVPVAAMYIVLLTPLRIPLVPRFLPDEARMAPVAVTAEPVVEGAMAVPPGVLATANVPEPVLTTK